MFVSFVYRDAPAALVGLRFGDQLLQVNGEDVAGWSTDKAMKYLKNCQPTNICMAIRDRSVFPLLRVGLYYLPHVFLLMVRAS